MVFFFLLGEQPRKSSGIHGPTENTHSLQEYIDPLRTAQRPSGIKTGSGEKFVIKYEILLIT